MPIFSFARGFGLHIDGICQEFVYHSPFARAHWLDIDA